MLQAVDYRRSLKLVSELAETDADRFPQSAVEALSRFVVSEITTLSICNLACGKREVIGTPQRLIGAAELAVFDRHFSEHPLVRYHGYRGGRAVQRISDCIPFPRFRETALYYDYYRTVGIDHAVALPVQIERGLLVSFVLNRRRRDFSDRERATLQSVAGALSALYRQSTLLRQLRKPAAPDDWPLSAREQRYCNGWRTARPIATSARFWRSARARWPSTCSAFTTS